MMVTSIDWRNGSPQHTDSVFVARCLPIDTYSPNDGEAAPRGDPSTVSAR